MRIPAFGVSARVKLETRLFARPVTMVFGILRVLTLLILLPAAISPGLASADATTADVVSALDINPSLNPIVDFEGSIPAGYAVVSNTGVATWAPKGSYLMLSTGNAGTNIFTRPADLNINQFEYLPSGALALKTSHGDDYIRVHLTVNVPAGATCWAVDWKFLSEEYGLRTIPALQFGDTFLIEQGATTFVINPDYTVTAPNNVVFDASHNLMQSLPINGIFAATSADAAGTAFDGRPSAVGAATTELTTIAGVPASGPLDLYFSIFDSVDSDFDSVVLLDNLRFLSGLCSASPVTVRNLLPTVRLTSPAAGSSFTAPANITVSANASDSDGSVTKVEFYANDGTSNTLIGTDTNGADGYSISWNNVPVGSYSLTAVATDNSGGTATSSPVSITVNRNHPPVVFAGGPYSAKEGSGVTLAGAAADPEGDPLAISWTVSDTRCTIANGSTLTPTVTCSDNGSFTATLGVDDGFNPVVSSSATLAVANVVPAISGVTASGAIGRACLVGNSVTLGFGFSDPGQADNPWSVDVNWGDGSAHTTYSTNTQGAQPQQTHTYQAGVYTVGISVTDKDGGKGTTTSTISHLYSMSGILQPFNPDGSSVWKYGSTIPVKVQITDCNNAPVPGLAPRIGTSLVSSSDPTLAIDEAASTSAADSTGVMRYDATSGQYIYNFGSGNLPDPTATYYMTVKGTDSSGSIVTKPPMVQVRFGLKSR